MDSSRDRVYIGLLAETDEGESRVALVPDDVRKLSKRVAISVEQNAGARAGFTNDEYERAGATLEQRAHLRSSATVLLSVQPPSDVAEFPRGTNVISLGGRTSGVIARMHEAGLHHLGLERVPRTTRAQAMDVLSSQATITGYVAVLEGARHLNVMLPMITTAAGSIRPAKMLSVGAGVVGLHAIATAKRLGAVTFGFDVREAAREQVESLGAMFISPTSLQSNTDAVGGYARAQSADEQEALRRTLAEHLAKMQLIITSAQIPGKRAPLLIDEAAVSRLAAGTVLVDLAAETGGNCALTKPDEIVVVGGVTILGPTNLAASLPTDASRLFSGNVRAVLEHIVTKDGSLSLDASDPITGALLGQEAPRAPAAA